MKSKITLILLLLIHFISVKLTAQVQINAPSSYQPVSIEQGGAPGAYKVDIINNNTGALNNATFSLALPAGMEYVAGSITGANQLNIANLQNPTFTLNSIPVGNTLQITFNLRINCGYSASTINYSVISGGSTIATGSSAVAGNTPSPAFVFPAVPNPQVLSTPLKTNAVRTIKFRNSGAVPVTTVYIESSVNSPAQYPAYKVMSANNGTVSAIANGYRITLSGTSLQNAITTAIGAANTSFDPGEEITVQLTEQMLSCALGSTIALNMKAGSGDTKGNFCFFDSSTASILSAVGNPSISLTRIVANSTFPTFCTNGKTSYIIANTGTGTAASALHDIKLPWSLYRTNAGQLPVQPSTGITLKKITIGGVDVTAQLLMKNGSGSGALIPNAQNVDVINFAALSSAIAGIPLVNLDNDGRFDDLMPGTSFQIDFEYGWNVNQFQACALQSASTYDDGNGYFNLGTSFKDQCGTLVSKFNYNYNLISDPVPVFMIGVQGQSVTSAAISKALFNVGDTANLTLQITTNMSNAYYAAPITKVFTIVLPDGIDYDSTGIIKYNTISTVPVSGINYNNATKTLIITVSTTNFNVYVNDNLIIPIKGTSSTVVNKTVTFKGNYSQNSCPGINHDYGCGSSTLNYAFLSNCPTVNTTNFSATRVSLGFIPDVSNTNKYYRPTGFVTENTPGINLQGAVSKDKIRFNIDATVNSTNYSQLWARVSYTSLPVGVSTVPVPTVSNLDPVSTIPSDVVGSISVTKSIDGAVLTTNITVADLVFSYNAASQKQWQQVNLGAKIGTGLAINYIPAVGDLISINWYVRVNKNNLPYAYTALTGLNGDIHKRHQWYRVGMCTIARTIISSVFK